MRHSIIKGNSGPHSRSFGSATVSVLASVMLMLAGVRAASAASCSTTISSCGCVISSADVFITSGALGSASSTVDCIDINASGAVLVVTGDITGPGGGVTADGIHIMSGASNVFITGRTTPGFSSHSAVGGFATGIQVDGSNAEIDQLDATGNVTNGVTFNNVTGSDYDDSSADSNAGGEGVLIRGGSNNIVADSAHDMNNNGIEISGSSSNRIVDSGAGSNKVYGIWFAQSSGNHIKDSSTDNNTGTGTYLGCFSTGGPSGRKCATGRNRRNSTESSLQAATKMAARDSRSIWVIPRSCSMKTAEVPTPQTTPWTKTKGAITTSGWKTALEPPRRPASIND
jgi:hypothetical protein